MSHAQDYHPYRTSILTRDELRTLSEPRPWRAVIDTAINWIIIIAAWAAVALYPNPLVIAAAVVVIGTRFYSLAIIGHDGLHRRLFQDRRRNDLFNDVAIVGAIGAITRINRVNHIEHHRVTATEHDPDRHKYEHDHKEPLFPFLMFLSGLKSVWPVFRNIFWPSHKEARKSQEPRVRERYAPRDVVILLLWQLLLIGGLTYFVGWWAYPVLWLLPVYIFAYCADLMRVFCEHSMLTSDADADAHRRMIHYDSNWFERQFFAPNNMNCHIAHHLWPQIPYYNLPAAENRIRDWAKTNDRDGVMEWRGSYVHYLLRYASWRYSADSKALTAGAGT